MLPKTTGVGTRTVLYGGDVKAVLGAQQAYKGRRKNVMATYAGVTRLEAVVYRVLNLTIANNY